MGASKALADWVKDLIDPDAREMALLELSKQREKFPELAPFLWNSFGTMAVLLQVSPSLPFSTSQALSSMRKFSRASVLRFSMMSNTLLRGNASCDAVCFTCRWLLLVQLHDTKCVR
jgi:Cell differentiation family, Rcd1-like